MSGLTRSLQSLVIMFALATTAARADPGPGFSEAAVDPDLKRGQEAIQKKDWDGAISALAHVREREPKNADVYNLLGFAERNRGNLAQAFELYGTALKLDPKHRGAHEYIGEAYLIANDLARAEEHLAALDKLCFFPCEEYSDLKKKIAAYKAKPK
ncbi:MAG TPA: tetratricopeptide repeat protein [Burkholderiaceae bacterium]|nr:tetratricopeptide repeat protein [Burkholderiaceae bacterium]